MFPQLYIEALMEVEPKLFDATMGAFTFYLVATGWMTVRRKAGTTGSFERAACAAAFLLAASVAALGIAARTSADGQREKR